MATYSDEILRLAEITPIAIPPGAVRAELANQLCGDRVAVSLALHDGVIAWVGWESEGCAILRASATYLSRTLSGKSLPEATDLVQQFQESFEHENLFNTGALAPVYKLPARYKCALLPWQAFENLLRETQR